MNDWGGQLGGDPCPGDPGAIGSFAGRLRTVSRSAQDLELRLGGIAGGLDQLRWTGEGADGVRTAVSTSVPDVVELASSYRDGAAALEIWAAELADLQRRGSALLQEYWRAVSARDAAAAEQDDASRRAGAFSAQHRDLSVRLGLERTHLVAARAAQQQTAALENQVHDLERRLTALSRQRDAATAEHSAADRRRRGAEDERVAALGRVRALRHDHEEGQRRAARVVLIAADALPNGNVLVTAWDRFTSVAHVVVTSDVFAAFIDATDTVGTWVSVAATVAAFVPFLQPVAGVLAVAALTLSGVTALGRFLQALNGTQSWETAGWAAFSFGVSGVGKMLAHAGQISKTPSAAGMLKRAIWYDNAKFADGPFAAHGIVIAGVKVGVAKAAPQLVNIAASHARAYLGLAAALKLIDTGHSLASALDDGSPTERAGAWSNVVDLIDY